MTQKNIPLYLTLFRLIVSPLFFPFLLFFFLPHNIFLFNMILAIFFLLISLTDFFDGYLARLNGLESKFGKMLDHIADKVWIGSTLIVLVAIHKIWFFWAILLIGRELFIAGLRQIACEHNLVIHVSLLGKIKTFIQIITIAWIIANPDQRLFTMYGSYWNLGELVLIISSVFISWWSARSYYQIFTESM
jgi:CDP-diacylglycerol--glycerol-3-phosphate 3-phosphatidyltransferase